MKAPIITPHPMKPPDLPGGGATRLTRENHLPGRLPVRVTPETLNPCASRPNSNGIRRPKPPSTVSDGPCSHGLLAQSESRYGNIDPFIHSTTPVGLALGPDSPRDDERGPGTLGLPAAGILTLLSLLMSAFSLPHSPRPGSPAASPRCGTLSYHTAIRPHPRLRWRA